MGAYLGHQNHKSLCTPVSVGDVRSGAPGRPRPLASRSSPETLPLPCVPSLRNRDVTREGGVLPVEGMETRRLAGFLV